MLCISSISPPFPSPAGGVTVEVRGARWWGIPLEVEVSEVHTLCCMSLRWSRRGAGKVGGPSIGPQCNAKAVYLQCSVQCGGSDWGERY